MKKVVSVLLSIMLVLTMCAGCQEKAAEPSGTDAAAPDATVQETQKPAEAPEASDSAASGELKDFTIGYAGLDESQEHLIPVGDNIEKIAKEKGEELGITIKVIRVDNAGDGAKAVENVDNLILQGIDVLVEFNLDAAVNDTIYEKCQNAGIPVMAIDIPVGDAPYMGANNVLAGQLCGEALGDLVNENWEGKVDAVLFEHTPEAGEVVQTRMDSILDGLANKTDYSVDDLKAITTTVSMKDDAILAQQLCADFLTANPDKTHIVIGSINDICLLYTSVGMGYVAGVVGTVCNMVLIYTVYRETTKECGSLPDQLPDYGKSRLFRRFGRKKVAMVLGMCVAALELVYGWYLVNQRVVLADDIFVSTQVTAHRGGARTAPENTMSALMNAVGGIYQPIIIL